MRFLDYIAIFITSCLRLRFLHNSISKFLYCSRRNKGTKSFMSTTVVIRCVTSFSNKKGNWWNIQYRIYICNHFIVLFNIIINSSKNNCRHKTKFTLQRTCRKLNRKIAHCQKCKLQNVIYQVTSHFSCNTKKIFLLVH